MEVKDLIAAILLAREDAKGRLLALKAKFPDAAPFIDDAIAFFEAQTGVDRLSALPAEILLELRALIESGRGPVKHSDLDLA